MAKKRQPITVTHDSDGGLTIHDPASGLVLSVVATHPDANGPKGLFVEAYAYAGGDVLTENVTRRDPGDESPIALGIARHPTFAFFGPNR